MMMRLLLAHNVARRRCRSSRVCVSQKSALYNCLLGMIHGHNLTKRLPTTGIFTGGPKESMGKNTPYPVPHEPSNFFAPLFCSALTAFYCSANAHNIAESAAGPLGDERNLQRSLLGHEPSVVELCAACPVNLGRAATCMMMWHRCSDEPRSSPVTGPGSTRRWYSEYSSPRVLEYWCQLLATTSRLVKSRTALAAGGARDLPTTVAEPQQ